MPSQRSSRLARAPLNTAHGNRRTMFPGTQARVSDAGDSELSRPPGPTYSQLIGSDHGNQERNSPMPPPRTDARRMHEGGSDSGYGSEIGRSDQPQSSLSSSSLATEDFNRNRATNLPHNGSTPHHDYPFGYTDRDRLYEQDRNMEWSLLSGWYDRRTGPYPPETSQAPSANPGHRYPSSSSSDDDGNDNEDYYTIPPEDHYTIPPRRSRYENDAEDLYTRPPQRSRFERLREERYRRYGHY